MPRGRPAWLAPWLAAWLVAGLPPALASPVTPDPGPTDPVPGSGLPLAELRQALDDDRAERSKRQEPADEEERSEYCDFGSSDEQHLCGWRNRNGSQLLWQQGSGIVANWLGGPPRDFTQGGDEKGGYMFFETSLLAAAPDARAPHLAHLESWTRASTGPEGQCVSFRYWVDGLSAAGLRMLLQPVPPQPRPSAEGDDEGGPPAPPPPVPAAPPEPERLLWSTKDPTAKEWRLADVLFTFSREHRIVFEGVAKDATDAYRKYRGFVAIDNVALKPGLECRGHCTYEGGFCGWTNEEDDDFDWTLGRRAQGRGSRNPSTGPATDRTSFEHGGGEGGYAYIDSGFPRRPGDTARLASPEFDPTDTDKPLCLRFWTHMYGNGVGRLSVLLSEGGGRERPLWRLSGEQGNAWYQAEVPVSASAGYRIIIEGKVGKNNLGDIALDDLSLSPGSCPTRGDCTFEVDECGWGNAAQRERVDDLDWERVSGQATRTSTHDHSMGSEKGFLMTLARNNVQRPGSRAWFASPEIEGGETPRCLSFWFVLNEPFIDNTGPSLGALAVYVRSPDRAGHPHVAPVWRLYNHQGPEWRHAQVPLRNTDKYSVVVEGTWGSSRANGFVGFDDITLYDGECSTMPAAAKVRPGECRFERDTCDWFNDTSDKQAAWRLATVSRRPANLPDKTFGAPEGYIYFDLFNQPAGSNTARLVSPSIPGLEGSDERELCFTFWFAAFGAGESAELRVLRQDNSSSAGDEGPRKLWVLKAQAVDTARASWSPAQVAVDAGSDFRVILEGEAVNGGFAVDDLTFSLGKCATRPRNAMYNPEEEEESS